MYTHHNNQEHAPTVESTNPMPKSSQIYDSNISSLFIFESFQLISEIFWQLSLALLKQSCHLRIRSTFKMWSMTQNNQSQQVFIIYGNHWTSNILLWSQRRPLAHTHTHKQTWAHCVMHWACMSLMHSLHVGGIGFTLQLPHLSVQVTWYHMNTCKNFGNKESQLFPVNHKPQVLVQIWNLGFALVLLSTLSSLLSTLL